MSNFRKIVVVISLGIVAVQGFLGIDNKVTILVCALAVFVALCVDMGD